MTREPPLPNTLAAWKVRLETARLAQENAHRNLLAYVRPSGEPYGTFNAPFPLTSSWTNACKLHELYERQYLIWKREQKRCNPAQG